MLRDRMRAVFSFPVAVGSILAWLVHQKAEAGVGDPDIWWHLENARLLVTTHHLPRFDTFSYTTLGHPWMDHEWLSEVAYYLAWRALGLTGVYLLFIVLLEIILLGIFYRCYKSSANPRGVWGSFLVSVFCVFLAAVSFGPRTLLFGWVWLIILLLVLDRFRARGEAPLWVIPLVFCLWVNSHGSWLIGMVVFGMIIASGLVEGNWGRVYAVRWSPRQLRQLLATLGASVAALFVNPFGYHLVFYPFDLAFRQKLTVNNIEEWASVDFHTARGKVVMVMLVGILLGALLSRYRWELGQLGLALLAVYAGATYVRFLFLAAILVAPLLASFLSFLPAYRPALDKPWLNAVVMAGIAAIAVAFFPSRQELEKSVADRFPAVALAYLKTHELPGNTFNHYMWGGYLVWKGAGMKTFVDSRSDIYEYSGVLQDYVDAITMKDSLKVLDKYRIHWVLFPPQEALSYLLEHNSNWKVVYNDHVAEIFERVGPTPAETPVAPVTATGQPASQPKAYQ